MKETSIDSSGTLVAVAVLTTAGGLLAVAVHAVYPLVLGVALAAVFYFWRQHHAQLRTVTQQETETAKRSAWISLLMLLFPSFFS